MERNFKIRVTNDKGEVGFYDVDTHSGGYPYICTYGSGKSLTLDEAKKIMDREFVYQGDKQFPVTLVRGAAKVNHARPVGWVDVEIVEIKYVTVETKRVAACVRSDSDMATMLISRLMADPDTVSESEAFSLVEEVRKNPHLYTNDIKKKLVERILL